MADRSICTLARTVILTEVNGLEALADSLGQNFDHAVQMLRNVKGRVVVAGIGKSGHVGQKMAATMASTGTPAQFVHPSEASHGDLGMVTKDDVVIAVSNSGETQELRDLVEYCFQKSIKLIAVTSRAGSMLDKMADATLLLPDTVKEACPLGLAPTTTTTMCLALGDALACTLLHQKGFTKEDFRGVHPGGSLGQRLAHTLSAKGLDATNLSSEEESEEVIPSCSKMSYAEEELSALSDSSGESRAMKNIAFSSPARNASSNEQNRKISYCGAEKVAISSTAKEWIRILWHVLIVLSSAVVLVPVLSFWMHLTQQGLHEISASGLEFLQESYKCFFARVLNMVQEFIDT